MLKVLVLTTGGTIASRRADNGSSVAVDGPDDLLTQFRASPLSESLDAVTIEVHEVTRTNSFLLSPNDMFTIARAVERGLATPDIAGVVVTHGTDTMEETAFLVDLFQDDARPVVFTGAQRSADEADADGPRNFSDAVTVAASKDARGLGVLIVFDGEVFAAAGTRKTHTLAPAAFSSTVSGSIGRVWDGSLTVTSTPHRHAPLSLDSIETADLRVDIVPYYPGADTAALSAVIAAGARGIILEGTGAGNANPAFCEELTSLSADGVVVVLSTRVASGPVAAIYGAGGGSDLLEAGAIPSGALRPPQCRIQLLALLASLHDPELVRQELRRRAQ